MRAKKIIAAVALTMFALAGLSNSVASAAVAPSDLAAECDPLGDGGCYNVGEFCSIADETDTGMGFSGDDLVPMECEDNNGWRWEAITAPTSSPFVADGHVITVTTTRATVGWTSSTTGWPNPGNHCFEVKEFGYRFSAADGSPHIGFTCDHGKAANDVGELTGLAAGHTYFLQVLPAVGDYTFNEAINNVDLHGGIDVFTKAA